MSNTLLTEAGRALYGSRWQTDLAQALGVNDRTVRRWVAGTESPRASVHADLMKLCQERSKTLDDLISKLAPF